VSETFIDRDMNGAVFQDVALGGARYTDVDLSRSSFRDVDMSHATLVDVDLSGATIGGCRLDGATIDGFEIAALIHAARRDARVGTHVGSSGDEPVATATRRTEMFDDYDHFARAYDRHWGRDAGRVLPLVEKLLSGRLRAGARVLDLCCGTGQFVQALIERGYEAVGLDGSAAQLSYARRNAPRAALVHADARSFSIAEPFEVVVCLNDSLNHVMTWEELVAVFRNVHAVLTDGGAFVFDLNTAHKYESWSRTFSFSEPDLVTIVRTNAELAKRIATFEAVIFDRLPTDCWRRSDASLRQTWYSDDQVTRALDAAGFSDVEVHPRSADKLFFSAVRRPPVDPNVQHVQDQG
jgi:SAM-dependent methyltransferase